MAEAVHFLVIDRVTFLRSTRCACPGMAGWTDPGCSVSALHVGDTLDPTEERRDGMVDDAARLVALHKVVLHDAIDVPHRGP